MVLITDASLTSWDFRGALLPWVDQETETEDLAKLTPASARILSTKKQMYGIPRLIRWLYTTASRHIVRLFRQVSTLEDHKKTAECLIPSHVKITPIKGRQMRTVEKQIDVEGLM